MQASRRLVQMNGNLKSLYQSDTECHHRNSCLRRVVMLLISIRVVNDCCERYHSFHTVSSKKEMTAYDAKEENDARHKVRISVFISYSANIEFEKNGKQSNRTNWKRNTTHRLRLLSPKISLQSLPMICNIRRLPHYIASNEGR